MFIIGIAYLTFDSSQKRPEFNQNQTSLPNKTSEAEEPPRISVVANQLEVPWSLAFLPDGRLIFTERSGRVKILDKQNRQAEPILISNVKQIGEGGLLGLAINPEFNINPYIYLYYTYSSNGDKTFNRVSRYKFVNNKFSDEEIIVDQIPGAANHNGGRLKFGPDNFLYITTGDASNPSLSQDKNSLAGKILRVTAEGKPASGNPFNSLIFSYGHRNPQGIAWDSGKKLYQVEHGQSATDEINTIESGINYGWPTIRGKETASGLEPPIFQSGSETWAPGGAAIYIYPNLKTSLFFGGLRGQTLFEYQIETKILIPHLVGEIGRIRDVVLGTDNMLYITTSNRDGRGNPDPEDDKILKVNPKKL